MSKVVGVAAAREIDNLRGMRLGVLGLGLREYLQAVDYAWVSCQRIGCSSLDQWEVVRASSKCCQCDSSKSSSRRTRRPQLFGAQLFATV